MADLDSRLKSVSKSVAAKKAAAAPKSTKDESLVVDSALYDWIELLDEGSGNQVRIENETKRIPRNLPLNKKLNDRKRSSDVLKLLTMREFGSTPTFTFEYLSATLPLTRKIKATIYMSLALIETPGCVYSDETLSTIHEDLLEGSNHALRWLASTCTVLPQVMLDRYLTIVKNILLRSGSDSKILEKALAALLNMWRSHDVMMAQYSDFLPL